MTRGDVSTESEETGEKGLRLAHLSSGVDVSYRYKKAAGNHTNPPLVFVHGSFHGERAQKRTTEYAWKRNNGGGESLYRVRLFSV